MNNQETDTPLVEPEATPPLQAPQPLDIQSPSPRPKKRMWLWILLIFLALALLVVVILWWLLPQKQESTSSNQQTQKSATTDKTADLEDDSPLGRFIKPQTGEKWYDKPKQLGNLKLFVSDKEDANPDDDTGPATYYTEVGTRGENKIIFRDEPVPGEFVTVFELDPKGVYHWIVQPTSTNKPSDDEKATTSDGLVDSIVTDNTTHYDSISVPAELTLSDNEKLTHKYAVLGQTPYEIKDAKVKVITIYGTSRLERVEVPNAETKLSNVAYRMVVPNGRELSLDYAPYAESLGGYTWTNGKEALAKDQKTAKYDTIRPIARGCGGSMDGITTMPGLTENQLKKVGTTKSGETVYGFKDEEANVYKISYDEYKKSRELNDEKIISKAEFIANSAVMIFKNSLNGYLVYVRNDYAPYYSCGKPVVYLYPTQKTTVSVKVGATVEVSEPLYEENGWQNVVAEPSGRLTYKGSTYSSLFWEGTGYGAYPTIASGTIVRRADAAATIRIQLAMQGLNENEINDFMAYWEDKIPNKPYVRLTWFSKSQIDSLAPLYVSKKPDTTIRVFLDMGGLDEKILLPPQMFAAPERKGFTVVEWGGLVSL